MKTGRAKKGQAAKGEAAESRACLECGGIQASSRRNYRYTLADDWAATIEGTEFLTCKKCGATEVVFERVLPMQRAIAAAVVRKPTMLAAQEVKFLRIHLALSAKELADVLGVSLVLLSRWESGKEPIATIPDRLLRAVVLLTDADGEKFDPRQLATISQRAAPLRLTARMRDGQWKAGSTGRSP